MKKLCVGALLTVLMLAFVALAFVGCDGVIKEGRVVAKMEVGSNGNGLESYGYTGVDEGYYVVVTDVEGKETGIFKAKNRFAWEDLRVDGEWEYDRADWLVFTGSAFKTE